MPDPVKVLVTMDISERLLNELREVSSRLQVEQALGDREEGVAEVLNLNTEILYTRYFPSHIRDGSRLQWIQFQAAGIDCYLDHALIRSPVAITTTSGAHAGPGTEFIIGLMIAMARKIPQLVKDQHQHHWDPTHSPEIELRDKILGIVGYGSIGRELARVACALGMRILAVKRDVHVLQDPNHIPVFLGDPEGRLPERIFAPAQLTTMLRESDFVVATAPLTRNTVALIGEDELRVMKPTSYLINVSRGAIVTMAALVRALRENWIAGAAVDVFESQPLSTTSEFWEVPNLLITPHVLASRRNSRYDERCNKIFVENLRRYLSQQPLLNLVRKELGY